MTVTNFADRLCAAIQFKSTCGIVGIDPALDRMPRGYFSEHQYSFSEIENDQNVRAAALRDFSLIVLEQVADLVPAIKPQSAYFETCGSAGVAALEQVIARCKELGLLVILDAKRGDIDATSAAYADAYLANQGPVASDALTVNPYLGEDGFAPFCQTALDHGNGVFVLVKTSNPGATAVQDQLLRDGRPVYESVCDLLRPWVAKGVGACGLSSIGIVVGATYPEQARRIRELLPEALILAPGFGAQGAAIEGLRACFRRDGTGAVINNSRAILYPHLYGDPDPEYRSAIRRATQKFIRQIREAGIGSGA